jgi:alanine-glyoxylate transaminase/serine-glyoxylate transaminase/serine-pyruvate transaminase
VTHLKSAFGQRPSLPEIEAIITSNKKPFKLITITHVDTSTGVLNNVEEIANLIKRLSPDSLIAVDGVCSVGGERLLQEAWGIDVAMTASQKAIGVPPGLALMVVSQRALVRNAFRFILTVCL